MKESILDEIKKERDYQDNKWGTTFDDNNSPHDFAVYITKYATRNMGGTLGQKTFISDEEYAQIRTDMIKVAAIAAAAVEAIDRKVARRWTNAYKDIVDIFTVQDKKEK